MSAKKMAKRRRTITRLLYLQYGYTRQHNKYLKQYRSTYNRLCIWRVRKSDILNKIGQKLQNGTFMNGKLYFTVYLIFYQI